MSFEILSRLDSSLTARPAARPEREAFLRLLNTARQPLRDALLPRVGSAPVAEALALKILNLCLAKFHFFARDTALLSRPFGLVVDPINNCNLACPGCVHSARSRQFGLFQWESGMLSPDRFAAFLNRYGPYAIEIMLCNYGEPLLNPNTPSFIRLARTWLLRTGLSTNMTAKRFDAAAYVASGLDFMTVSIDGASQSVYERYRKTGDLEMAFRNLRSLIAARAAAGKRTPIVSWQFLAFEHNAHEIDAAAAIARDLGVDQFVVANPFDVGWDDPGVRPAAVESRTIQFHSDSDQRLIDNWNPFPDQIPAAEIARAFSTGWAPGETVSSASQASHTCHWLYKNMVMDANGRIIPCCAAPKPETDLVFANAFQNAASDDFNSPKYQLARQSFSNPAAYAEAIRNTGLTGEPSPGEPYCAKCEWNQTSAHTDSEQVAQYFRTVGQSTFDQRTIQLLSSW
jgi:MoaA/NifB/PqqE/SkfB family radical SAM enzyme